MRDEGIGIRFQSDLAPLIKANDLTDKLVDKWAIINRELDKSGDTTSFSRGMSRANAEIKRNVDTSRQLRSSITETGNEMQRMGSKSNSSLSEAARHTTALGRSYSAVKDKASSMWHKINNGEAASKTNADLNKVQDNLSRVGNSATKSGNRVSESQRKTRLQTDKTTTSFGRLRDVGGRLANMGNTIALAMLPVAAAFKKSAEEATELENRYKTIQNLLHTGGESAAASKAQSKAMEKENNKFALQYGVAPTEMAKGGEELVRRGYSGAQELASHKYFLQASRASGDPYNAVVGYGAPALEQFGYKTKAGDSKKKMAAYTKMVLNQMAYGADLSATDFSGMGEALKYSGATAKSGNQSLAGTIADIGVLSNNGQDGSISGTGLRKVINSLLAPSSGPKGQGTEALKSLGLSPDDLRNSKGNLMSLDKEFELLNSHMKGMSSTQKATLFHKLFGATGQESALILSANVKQMKSLNDQVARAPKYGKNGYIADLAQKNMSSWQNQIDVFKQHLNVMGLDFTKTVLPGFTKLLSIGNKFLGILIKMPEPVKKTVGYTTAIASAITAAVVSSKLLRKGFSWVNGSGGRSTTVAANQAVTDSVPDIGSRSGSMHYSGVRGNVRNWMNNSRLGGMAKDYGYVQLGIQGVQAISNASTIFTKGITSSQGAKAAWTTGGQLVGGGIGAFLGGPAGAGIGAQIGGFIAEKIPKAVKQSVKTEQKWSDDPKHGVQKGSVYIPDVGWSFDPRKTGVSGGSRSNRNTPHKPSAPSGMTTSRAYGDLSKSNASYIKKAVSLEQQGNIAWAQSAGKTSTKVSAIYNKLYKLADKQAQKQLSSSQKGLSYLQKQGLLSSSAASKAKNAEQSSINSRLRALRSGISKINSDSKLSYSQRAKLIQRNNAQIISLTDRGAQKQKSIMRGLMSSTTHLTTSGYAKILTSSRKNEQQTVSNARKTYSAEKSSANKRYATNVHLAKTLPKLSADQRRGIIAQAEKQRSQSISKAYNQYKGAVKYAEKQRRDVVSAAKKEAGDAARAFSTAAKDVGSSIPALITQNVKLGLSTRNPKFKSSDLTNSRNSGLIKQNRTLNRLATHSRTPGQNGTASKATKPKLPGNVFSTHATGGKISRTQTALVGEGGPELAYTVRGKKARLLGVNGPQMARLKPGEHILNAQATKRVLAGNYGQSLPGYAAGTNSLGTSKASNSVNKFSKKSKKTWDKTYSDTAKSTKKIRKNTIQDYDATQKGGVLQLSQLSKQNRSYWSSIYNKTGAYTNNIRKSSVKDFDSMQKGVQGQMNQVRKGVTSAAEDTATGFGHALGKMDNYAHKAMSNTITQLNNGIKGIDKSLGQFGGNNSVINPIHYAAGSNGQLTENQIAMVNDAESGPRQEGIIRNNQLYAPKGKNRVIGLQRGDAVLNGNQMQRLTRANGITHYAKGSGVSNSFLKKLIKSSAKNPSGWLKNNMTVNIKTKGSDLAQGATSEAKGAYRKYANPWAGEVWNQMQDARSGGGSSAGGNWAHTPGLPESNGFNARRGSGLHDGVDFAGPIGSVFRAVHGGTVTRTGGSNPWNDFKDLGNIITVKSDDGFQEIYQEFGNTGNIKVHTGDQIKTGQALGTLGRLAGHDVHVHVGVSRGSLWNHGGYSHNGWYDVTKMHGHSSGNAKGKSTKHSSALSKLVAKEIAPQLKWVGKHLVDKDSVGGMGGAGGNAKASGSHLHWLEQAGIPKSWYPDIVKVINRESGWNPKIANGSGAYGIPQSLPGSKMASAGSDWRTNPITQLKWMKGYIKGRYKNAAGAWAHELSAGWYAKGGIPKTNKASVVGEKGAELFMPNVSGRVFTAKDTATMAGNMTMAALSVHKMLEELKQVMKRPAVGSSSYRHTGQSAPTIKIETHDKFEFHIGSGAELNERAVEKMIKAAVRRERQSMARQIIEQFGGAK